MTLFFYTTFVSWDTFNLEFRSMAFCGTSFHSEKLGYAEVNLNNSTFYFFTVSSGEIHPAPSSDLCVSTCSPRHKELLLLTTAGQVDTVVCSFGDNLFPLVTLQVPLRAWGASRGGKTLCASLSGSQDMSAIPVSLPGSVAWGDLLNFCLQEPG